MDRVSRERFGRLDRDEECARLVSRLLLLALGNAVGPRWTRNCGHGDGQENKRHGKPPRPQAAARNERRHRTLRTPTRQTNGRDRPHAPHVKEIARKLVNEVQRPASTCLDDRHGRRDSNRQAAAPNRGPARRAQAGFQAGVSLASIFASFSTLDFYPMLPHYMQFIFNHDRTPPDSLRIR